jgi:hypothetical protein
MSPLKKMVPPFDGGGYLFAVLLEIPYEGEGAA